jgi:hypothetical protein
MLCRSLNLPVTPTEEWSDLSDGEGDGTEEKEEEDEEECSVDSQEDWALQCRANGCLLIDQCKQRQHRRLWNGEVIHECGP